jgi:hypothetical protein
MNKIFSYTKAIYEKYNWGFNKFGEKLNGRIAMISIVNLILVELFLKQSIINYLFKK